MLLDMMATLLSGGRATHEIPADPERETGLSQVFMAVDSASLTTREEASRMIDAIVASTGVRYPGQRTAADRRTNMAEGIPVDADAWRFARACAGRTLA